LRAMKVDPAQALRERSLRVTPQRRAILGAFTGTPDEHLSAEEVHSRASTAVPELGRGTVYATLAELTELGLLAALGNPEPVRYETNIAPHEHFRCRLCIRVFDVELTPPSTAGLEREGFMVERVAVSAEGICTECREYERGLRQGVEAIGRERQIAGELLETLACSRYDSHFGTLLLAASERGIVRMALESHADFDFLLARCRSRVSTSSAAKAHLAHATEALEAYLAGDQRQAEEALDPETPNLVSLPALQATRLIPYGEARSYDRLGVPIAPYDCGYAMGTNPIPILFPSHRVTRGSERLDLYIGGVEMQQLLLKLEAGL
jgi:O-6-methylguanine DNA methyltransferase